MSGVPSSTALRVESIDIALADMCAEYADYPYEWVMAAFDWGHGALAGFPGPDVWQREWLEELGREIRERGFDGIVAVNPVRMSTASGHGIGKSALVSMVIMFIASTRPFSKGTVTANTGDQLKNKTWAELAKWKNLCITGHWFELTSGKGSMSMYHKSWPEEWRVAAQTCREENSEAFAGQHAITSTSYYIFDEASAVPDKIWEVAEGGLTDGEPMFFAFGNPTRTTGKFAETLNASSRWIKRQIDSRTARGPNKKQIQEWIDDYGEDSDFVRVRVRGMMPRAGDMQYMPSDVVSYAMSRPLPMYLGDDPLICGIDMARGGADNCMIVFRRGFDARSEKVYKIPGEKSRDSMRVISKLTMVFKEHKPDVIFIDATGLGGPVGDRLRQLGFNVFDVHFGSNADDEKLYANKTSEMGARMLQWMRDGGALPKDPALETELTVREFWHDSKDRLVLESKPDLKKRMNGLSPDWADAYYVTFAQAVPTRAQPRGMLDVAPHARDNVAGNYDYNPLDAM